MSRSEFVVITAVFLAVLVGVSVWRHSAEAANARHCNEMLDGLAVVDGSSGRVVCIKRDAVLQIYR